MVDFLPPDDMTMAEAGDALSAHLQVIERGTRDIDQTFYDTFDGLLHAAGRSCVHHDGRLVLVDRASGEELRGMPAAPPTQPLLAVELDPGPLREDLLGITGVRALLPLVHVHSRAHALGLLDGVEKTVVRITLEAPALVSSSSVHRALRPRLRLTVVRGYDQELAEVARRLEHELGFRPADQPLVDEAMRAWGRAPGGVSAKIDVPLAYDQRADDCAARVLRRLLEVIEANLGGTIADTDSEFLHDFRVAVRRTRSVLREFKRAFPAPELARFRAAFRWLQQATGDARDLDVYVLEFDRYVTFVPEPMRPDLSPLLRVLRNRRLSTRREMVHALRSPRAAVLLADWQAFLNRISVRPGDGRPDAPRAVGDVAGERIAKVYRKMVKMGQAIDASSPAAEYHELRKKGKELRYLLELFAASLYPAEIVKPMIRTLKALQDVLGRNQDRGVQIATIRSVRDEVSALPDGPAALMAMGVLVERLGEDAREARSEFASRFATFASKTQRALVKETFG